MGNPTEAGMSVGRGIPQGASRRSSDSLCGP